MVKNISVIGIIVIAAVIVKFMFMTKPQAKNKAPEKKATLVEIEVAEKVNRDYVINSQGNVSAQVETSLVSEVSGTITFVSEKFASGATFVADEVLLKIDATDYEVAVKQAKAMLAGAKAKLAQEQARSAQAKKDWQALSKNSEPSDLVLRKPFLAEAEANVKSAESDLERAETKLRRTVIRAPYAGLVKEKITDFGQYVTVGTRLGTVFSTEKAEVRLPINAGDVPFLDNEALRAGSLPIELEVSYGKKTESWKGVIKRQEGTIDQQSRVHYVIAEINDPYLRNRAPEDQRQSLKVGSFVKAKIRASTLENVVAIPRKLILDDNAIFVVNDEFKLESRQLNIVTTDKSHAYVNVGLDTGDRIMLTRVPGAVDGMAVKPVGFNDELDVAAKKTETSDQAAPL